MTRVSITIPVILTSHALLEMTCSCLRSIKPTVAETQVVICVNRLKGITPERLPNVLQQHCDVPVLTLFGDRGIAASWNEGCIQGLARGADFLVLLGNDTVLQPECLDVMTRFGLSTEFELVDLWGGLGVNYPAGEAPASLETFEGAKVTDGSDFTCVMLRAATFEKFGWFDENFWPAYYEDSDYIARIITGGGQVRTLHAVQFFHAVNGTYNKDPRQAQKVNKRLPYNWWYFKEKWGSEPVHGRENILKAYYPTPFNKPGCDRKSWPLMHPEYPDL